MICNAGYKVMEMWDVAHGYYWGIEEGCRVSQGYSQTPEGIADLKINKEMHKRCFKCRGIECGVEMEESDNA